MGTNKFKEKIIFFFNHGWLNQAKYIFHLKLTTNIDKLVIEYGNVFNIKMTKAQIIEMLVSEELKRVQDLPPYRGNHAFVSLYKRKRPFGEFGELEHDEIN